MVHSVSLSHSTDGAPWPRKDMMTVLGKQFAQCWHGKVASQVMVKDSVADRMIKSWLRNFASSEMCVVFSWFFLDCAASLGVDISRKTRGRVGCWLVPAIVHHGLKLSLDFIASRLWKNLPIVAGMFFGFLLGDPYRGSKPDFARNSDCLTPVKAA